MADKVNHRFHRWLTSAITYERDWRKASEGYVDFFDGDQWTEEEEAVLSARGQQASVLNVIRPTIDLLLSMEAERRIDFQIVGREEADTVTAMLLTELLKQVEDACDADFWTAAAFRDAVMVGRGWVEALVRKGEDGEKQVAIEHVPWELVYADPFHRKIDGSDARFVIRAKWVDLDVAKKLFPGKADLLDTTFTDDYEGVESWAQQSGSDRAVDLGYYDAQTGRVWLAECWYRDSEGKARYCMWSDEVFLRGDPENDKANENPYGDQLIPLIMVPCYRNRKGEPYGIVKLVMGMQQALNQQNSKYIWNTSSNRLLVEAGAIDDLETAREEWNRPDGMVTVNAGALAAGKIKSEDSLRESAMLMQYMQFLLGMIQRTSGINDALTGLGGPNERSAQQQAGRASQGAAMQTSVFENLFQSRKRITAAVLRLIGRYCTGRQVARVVGADGMVQYYEFTGGKGKDGAKPFLDMGDILRYDVVMKPVAPFTTTRQNTLQIFSEVAKTGVFPPQIAGEIMLELSDLPNKKDIQYRLKKALDAQAAAAAQQAQAEASQAAGAAPGVA